ncbi:MAG TPA: nitroreductase family protein [Spirochaetota bacterium]|nr:nitroreductase family protein [Spirochaetota bacterium]HPC40950.1 nitroreductase family protein [Spirochaetota bacterium]HPL18422.1 nitroreductase family protein [Spirochaetota bacterium]HQF08620.1 nitroreductase family protein [Spirochaetota bacterium]HQH97335.1 nitroreductase family protein [Spirochaetota bacterium]
MDNKRSITEIIGERYANRTYREKPISPEHRELLDEYLASPVKGPFGATARFLLVAAREGDSDSLRGLGTYGIIKNPAGFIAGAIDKSDHYLEDYGYLLERIVLYATALGLGTCWLGGTFRRSGFARSISIEDGEAIPAVIAIGYPADRPGILDSIMRFGAGSKHRKPWEKLFFIGDFTTAMTAESAGAYRVPIEMVRRAPSASNKQPWRIVRDRGRDNFHFILARTKNYYRNWKIVGMEDLQRVDMGIAMHHFEATAAELKLKGAWTVDAPNLALQAGEAEYIVTWKGL